MKTATFRATIILLSLFLSVGCGNQNDQKNECASLACQQQELYDQIILVHDEVMPKLSDIAILKGKIKEQLALATDSVVIMQWQDHLQALDAADQAMWVWMRQFESEMDTVVSEATFRYFEEQMLKVDTVAFNINRSIEHAEQALGNDQP